MLLLFSLIMMKHAKKEMTLSEHWETNLSHVATQMMSADADCSCQ